VNQALSLGKEGDMWTHQTATGLSNSGYGIIRPGKDSVDTDQDGIPDWWEKKHGLSPTEASDARSTSLSADGYTNLEMYLDELAGDPVVYKGVATGVTASPLSGGLQVRLEDGAIRIEGLSSSARVALVSPSGIRHALGSGGSADRFRLPQGLSGVWLVEVRDEHGVRSCPAALGMR
jgi:hypothetical protein